MRLGVHAYVILYTSCLRVGAWWCCTGLLDRETGILDKKTGILDKKTGLFSTRLEYLTSVDNKAGIIDQKHTGPKIVVYKLLDKSAV